MARAKGRELIVREPPSNFCAAGRHWVESQEKIELFSSYKDEAGKVTVTRPAVWTCPLHRGEAPAEVAPEVLAERDAQPKAGVDLMKDERQGPKREIIEVLEHDAVRSLVKLECQHTVRIATKFAKYKVRCRKCRPAKTRPVVEQDAAINPSGFKLGDELIYIGGGKASWLKPGMVGVFQKVFTKGKWVGFSMKFGERLTIMATKHLKKKEAN